MIDYRFSDDFLFLFVLALPKIGPVENHHAQFPGDVQLGADLGRYQWITTDEALDF